MELVTRKVLAERRRLYDQITKERREAERRNTDDPIVATAIGIMSDILSRLEGEVLIRVQCMVKGCKAFEDIAVRIEDPQRTIPRTMLCGVHANPKDD